MNTVTLEVRTYSGGSTRQKEPQFLNHSSGTCSETHLSEKKKSICYKSCHYSNYYMKPSLTLTTHKTTYALSGSIEEEGCILNLSILTVSLSGNISLNFKGKFLKLHSVGVAWPIMVMSAYICSHLTPKGKPGEPREAGASKTPRDPRNRKVKQNQRCSDVNLPWNILSLFFPFSR